MTKARSRGKVRPSYDPLPPVHGSRGFARVLARGCGGYNCNHPLDPSEYDCKHNYDWSCDDCPIVVERNLDEEALLIQELLLLQGPPREFSHPAEYWMSPGVASELHWYFDADKILWSKNRLAKVDPVSYAELLLRFEL